VPIFDADDHLPETREAFTRFLPDHYKDVVRYVDIDGRTKFLVNVRISEYIPNPTFVVVARPGAQEYYRSSIVSGTPGQRTSTILSQFRLGADSVILHGAAPAELEPILSAYRAERPERLSDKPRNPGRARE
jgi:hypothetical protein